MVSYQPSTKSSSIPSLVDVLPTSKALTKHSQLWGIFVLLESVIDVLVQLSYAKRTCKFKITMQYMLIIFPLGSISSFIPNCVSRS